jgi:microcompartment protein CcmL/EutN
MKKLLALVAITGTLIACNNAAEQSSTTEATADTSSQTVTPAPENTAVAPAKDSLMQFKDGKVMIMVGGTWSALSAAITTSNGRK